MVGSNKNSLIKRYCPSKGKEPSKIRGGVFFVPDCNDIPSGGKKQFKCLPEVVRTTTVHF